MTYFSEDFIDFFKELAANNNKEWFDANRKRYDKSVKEPFKNFIQALIDEISTVDPKVQIPAKDAIFRINRDIRFSPDKTPYKLDRSANISPAGRKDHSVPGFYIALGPESVHLGGGAYSIKPDKLAGVRTHIMNNMKRFEELVSSDSFKSHYGQLKGEEHKRLPKEMKEAGDKQPLLYKKQLYYMTDLKPELITSSELMSSAMTYYKAGLPVQQFLAEVLE